MSQYIMMSPTGITHITKPLFTSNMSYRQISCRLEAARLYVIMIDCIALKFDSHLDNAAGLEKSKAESGALETSRGFAVKRPPA